MYFKSLQLVGFKSFAEKTVIGFEPGITTIVGPNGCGKSNVSDAIRWVLGEQNARNLRGSLMEDLIFGGSSALEPMGMAEVSLTLGDARGLTEDDCDEVTVSRRLFRSGESQYFLNKRPCRLRDIHRVFMDTGLGTQAYSFVQQGNIDLILSSKPEDRRFLFDETAGISTYKANKKIALRKLEGTEANLARLSDLLREVKRQIISIQRQAGKARRYKQLADRLQNLEVGFLLYKRSHLTEKKESLERKRRSVEKVLNGLTQEIEQRESRIREVRAELRSSELQHEQLQARRLDVLRNIDRESANISLHEQRIADTNALSESVSMEIKEMKQKVAGLEGAIREKKESLDDLSQRKLSFDRKRDEKELHLSGCQAELRRAEALSTELSNRLLDLIGREMETRSRLSSTDDATERNRRVLAELQQHREQLLHSTREKEEARTKAERKKEQLSGKLRNQKETFANIRGAARRTEQELTSLRADLLRVESTVSQLASERRFLAEAVQQYEGYDAGVRSVIQESKAEGTDLRGIIGTVADVIEVSPGYEECAQAALGHRVQWVLTETMGDAKRAAAYLREKSCGKATFLALNSIQGNDGAGRTAQRLCRGGQDSLRPVLELISFDGRYAKVMDFLLGSTILARDFSHAIDVARENDPGLSFVTASGEKVESAFAITAGNASPPSLNLVSRKSRLASLAQEEDRQGTRLDDLRKREQLLLESQTDLREKAEHQSLLISDTEETAAEVARNLLGLSKDIELLERGVEELEGRRAETESDLNRLEEQRKIFSQELAVVNGERSEIDNVIAANRKALEKGQRDAASLEKEVAELALARASFDERIRNLHSDMEYMRGQLDLTKKDIDSRGRQLEEGEVHVKRLRAEIEECRTAVASLNQEKEKVAAAIDQLDQGRKVRVDGLTQLEWDIKEKSNAAREREKEVNDLDIKLAEIRFSVNGIDGQLMNEYGLNYDDPAAVPMSEENDPDHVQRTITQMKRQLQSMGPVNLCALDQHEALKKRYHFLVSQQADLLEAKDSLLKAIAKLDRESKAIFQHAFERIRKEFREMFKRLFGGGRADLVLVDESDILESGIEIIARPPGKKLQTISLLSGGERAMAAISLLFAIFKVKPSPFCLLDEIDAPLDDSNILRFAEVLREFAEGSQFIIITHNKRTIAASDVLYGVTMEDSGKSKVVSARLTRRKEEASASRAAEASSQPSNQETLTAATMTN